MTGEDSARLRLAWGALTRGDLESLAEMLDPDVLVRIR